ncbi:MAG: hypothetical protein ACK5KO_08225 [Arachnia sp.]
MTGLVLLHGAAATPRIYRLVARLLAAAHPGLRVEVPQRPCSGDLDREIAAVAGVCENNFVAGVSGGATLALGLALAGVPTAGILAHEPAVGRLAPGLLRPALDALAEHGPEAFGSHLYGPAWTPEELPAEAGSVYRDVAMFAGFDIPEAADLRQVHVSLGARSGRARHNAAAALHQASGAPVRLVPGVAHAWMLEDPVSLAITLTGLMNLNWHDGPILATDASESSCLVPPHPPLGPTADR